MKKVSSLKKVQEVLQDIPDINLGGCGIAALAIYRWLKKQNKLNDNTWFVYCHLSKDTSYHDNKSALESGNLNGVSCSHVLLYHNGFYIDSDSKKRNPWHNVETLDIKDERFVVSSLNNPNAVWCCLFERADNVPKISKLLDIDLSDIIKVRL